MLKFIHVLLLLCLVVCMAQENVITPITNLVAYHGPVLGVGRLTVQDVPQLLEVLLQEQQLRILYVTHSQIEKGQNVYFLFRGKEPLQLLGYAQTFTNSGLQLNVPATFTPLEDTAAYTITLKEWWESYQESARNIVYADVYPPQTWHYLTDMLSRRLQLPPVYLSTRWWTAREDFESVVGLFLGTESVKVAMQKERLLNVKDIVEPLDQGLPSPLLPQAVELPPVDPNVAIESMAFHIPEECFYLRCGSFANFQWMRKNLDEWGGNIRDFVSIRGQDNRIKQKIEKQIALRETTLGKLLGGLIIQDVALIGTDTFLREGASLGLIFQSNMGARLQQEFDKQRQEALENNEGATLTEIKVFDKTVSLLSTPDNSVRSFYVIDGEFHFVTNCKYLVQRFLEAGRGQASLGLAKEFHYARTKMPLSRNDTVFLYLSDGFFRELLSPQYRVEMTRRMVAETDINLVQLARLAAVQEGKNANSVEELIKGGFLPPNFGKRSDGTTILMQKEHVLDSLRGAHGSFLPIPDVELKGLTKSEADGYKEFVQLYRQDWERMDPVILGAQRLETPPDSTVEKIAFDLHIMPYAQRHYGELARILTTPQKIRMIDTPNNVVKFEFQGTESYYGLRYLAAVLQDFEIKFAIRDGHVDVDRDILDYMKAYVVTNPEARTMFREPRKSEKIWKLERFLWGGINENFFIISTGKSAVAHLLKEIKMEPAKRPAQVRLFIGNLAQSKIRKVLDAFAYERSVYVTWGNASFLEHWRRQFGLDAENTRDSLETTLGIALVCPMGGDYEAKLLGTSSEVAMSVWSPTQANPTSMDTIPEDYRFPLIDWLRSIDIEFNIDEKAISTHVELELQTK